MALNIAGILVKKAKADTGIENEPLFQEQEQEQEQDEYYIEEG